VRASLLAAVLVAAPMACCAPKAPPECKLSASAQRARPWAKTCAGCHDIDIRRPAAPSGGPNLHDIYGAVAGTQSLKYGYEYKPPLVAAREKNIVWTDDNLDQYLRGPEAFLKSRTNLSFDDAYYMNFFIGGSGGEQEQSRRDVIEYFKEIKNRACECAVPGLSDKTCSPR
jgi:cytochrome c2